MLEPAAVDVEGFEDFVDGASGDSTGDGPEYHMQVFFTGFELIQDRIEKVSACDELPLKETKVAAIEFDPELFALKVLDPACPKITCPVTSHPLPDTSFAEVITRLLALDPFVPVLFLDAGLMNAPAQDRHHPVVRSRK